MPSKTSAQRLRDILENIDLVQAFTSGLAYTDFESDRKTVYAVVRALEIISEATRGLPGELKGCSSPRMIRLPRNVSWMKLRRHSHEWPVPGFEKFRICYIPRVDHIDVLRVLHGARDSERFFE